MENQNVNLQSKLFKKLNSFSKFSVKLVFLGLLTPISVGLLTPTSADTAFAAEPPYAYPVCYFKNPRGRVWKWGLNSNNSWFVMSGRWEKNRDTDTWKFYTTTRKSHVESSCKDAKRYYGVTGNIDGIYAAMKSTGNNYEIVYR
jgi:hypothetical protein